MTLFEFEELAAYWTEHPPLHILIAAYLGVGKDKHKPMPPTLSRSGRQPSSNLEAAVAELGPGFGTGDVHAGLAPVVLDFVELRRRTTASD